MDAAKLVNEIETAKDTELGRLATPKVLIARTGAELERDAILRAVVDLEYHAAGVIGDWVGDAAGGTAADFEDAADRHRACANHVAELLDGYEPTDAPGPVEDHLAGVEGEIPRVAAGLVAHPLVLRGTITQVIGFFINEADPQTTDRFRDVKDDQEAILDRGRGRLDAVCTDEADWDDARAAAEALIDVAYDEYVASLDTLGINPKPVC